MSEKAWTSLVIIVIWLCVTAMVVSCTLTRVPA